MKNLLCILLLVSLSGCVSEKQCLRKYPPQITEVEKVITHTETKYRDTTIYYPLPPEIIYNTDTVILTEDGFINSEQSMLQTSLAISIAQIRNNMLYHNLQHKDTTIELRLENALKEINTLETLLKEKATVIEVPAKISWFNKFLIALGWLVFGGLLSLLLLVILRR